MRNKRSIRFFCLESKVIISQLRVQQKVLDVQAGGQFERFSYLKN